MSSIGVITDCALFDRDIHIPSGIPIVKHSKVAAEIMVTVEIIGVHIPKKPIAKNANTTPSVTFILREPSQARAPAIARNNGQALPVIIVQIGLKNRAMDQKFSP